MIYDQIPKMIAGSALAGFGLSIGRDFYKGGKKLLPQVFLILVAIAFVLLARQSMVWMFRNYRDRHKSILIRIICVPLFLIGSLISFVVLMIPPAVFSGFVPATGVPGVESVISVAIAMTNFISPVLNAIGIDMGWLHAQLDQVSSADASSQFMFAVAFVLYVFLIASGIRSGLSQRKARRQAWEAEAHNFRFLFDNELRYMGDDQYKDKHGNLYRLKNIHSDRVELLAVGRRNKRGFIFFDRTGKFTDWSGLVSI